MPPEHDEIRKIALRNAYLHEGVADFKSVMNKIMGEFPEARSRYRETSEIVKSIVDEVNMSPKERVMEIAIAEIPELAVKEKRTQEHRLIDLADVTGEVRMRLAPSPSGPLHIGHSRMAILNDEYVKRYGGRLFLRIEDTNPANIDLDAYDMIPEDLDWLGVHVDEIVIQSKRMDFYYSIAKKLILSSHMYICECSQQEFKSLKLQSKECPHRTSDPETNMEKFERMISGGYSQGQVSAVVKTDLNHPNPSIRDWIAFRVKEETHPLSGKTYFAYPMMNFSVAVDDHDESLTHVIRGKDHLNNTEKQSYIYRYMKWKPPHYYHYGLVHIPGVMLKTSLMKKGIREGKYTGWSDIRLATFRAMKLRGYRPETFRRYWIESGMHETDSEFSWDIFNSFNRELVDRDAKRLWFVPNPTQMRILGSGDLRSNAPFHPGNPSLGTRKYHIGKDPEVSLPGKDLSGMKDGEKFRLKDLCNVALENGSLRYIDNSHENLRGMKIIQWAPAGSGAFCVEKPDGSSDCGLIEPLVSEVKGVTQLERYGYVNLSADGKKGYFLHK